MITLENFKAILKKAGSLDQESEETITRCWDSSHKAACLVKSRMPGIGFFSVAKRMNCFLAVCSDLDALIDRGEITLEDSQLALNILRLSDSTFTKAITIFDIRGTRFRAIDRVELPNSAHEYLKGLEYTSRR